MYKNSLKFGLDMSIYKIIDKFLPESMIAFRLSLNLTLIKKSLKDKFKT